MRTTKHNTQEDINLHFTHILDMLVIIAAITQDRYDAQAIKWPKQHSSLCGPNISIKIENNHAISISSR